MAALIKKKKPFSVQMCNLPLWQPDMTETNSGLKQNNSFDDGVEDGGQVKLKDPLVLLNQHYMSTNLPR